MANTQATEYTQLVTNPRWVESLPGPSLTALPLELIIEICTHLCGHCRPNNDAQPTDQAKGHARSAQAALAGLSRTCKVLRTVAEPFLFHRIHLSKVSAYYLFVRTLIERPELRPNVCEITDITPSEIFYFRSPDKVPIAAPVQESLISGNWAPLWDALVLAEAAATTSGSDAERLAALGSLLLHLAPNLASFSLCVGDTLSYESLKPLKRWNAAQPAKSIRRLSLAAFRPPLPHGFPGFKLNDAIHILQGLPNLEDLHLRGCTMVPDHLWGFWGCSYLPKPVRLEALTELVLIDCHVTSTNLRNLLKAPGPNLARVIIRNCDGRTPAENMELEHILQALRPWTQTLRELTYRFTLKEDQALAFDQIEQIEQIEPLSLPAFDALEVLDITTLAIDFSVLEHLEGAFTNCLPPSLRKLRLPGGAYLSMAMDGILDARVSGRLPNLTRIELNEQEDWCDNLVFADQDREMIAAVGGLRSEGVEVIVHPLGQEF